MLVLFLLPVAIYFATVAVLLLFRVFRHRKWVIANVVGSVLAAVLACVALAMFALPQSLGRAVFLASTAAVLGFGVIAPWLQYRAARAEWRTLSALIMVLASLELGLPLAALLVYKIQMVQFEQAREQTEQRGREARAGDLAAAVRGRTAAELHTFAFHDFLSALEYSPLLRDAAPLHDDDRIVAERLIADRDTYFGPLHAKLIWDSHASHGVDALLADPDAPALRYHLLGMLERHAATRYCGDAETNRVLREGVRAWFMKETPVAPAEVAARDARIESLCTAVNMR